MDNLVAQQACVGKYKKMFSVYCAQTVVELWIKIMSCIWNSAQFSHSSYYLEDLCLQGRLKGNAT